ncbi:MAG: hypothetical protein ACRC28_08580 [Clostridium sp.]|uniref:hypothetical protein n=1 Tax=Clostridia TaxID=186801 RepID=UPI003F33A814
MAKGGIGINTGTIIYTRRNTRKKDCKNCSKYRNRICKEFKIDIYDTTSAEVCDKFRKRATKKYKSKKK